MCVSHEKPLVGFFSVNLKSSSSSSLTIIAVANQNQIAIKRNRSQTWFFIYSHPTNQPTNQPSIQPSNQSTVIGKQHTHAHTHRENRLVDSRNRENETREYNLHAFGLSFKCVFCLHFSLYLRLPYFFHANCTDNPFISVCQPYGHHRIPSIQNDY